MLEAPKRIVSEGEFETVVRGALDAVGGTLLFKVRLDAQGEPHHARRGASSARATTASSCC